MISPEEHARKAIEEISTVEAAYMAEYGARGIIDRNPDVPGVLIFWDAKMLVDDFGDIQITYDMARQIAKEIEAKIAE